MAQRLGVLTTLAKDQGWIPSTYRVTHSHLSSPVTEALEPSSSLCGHQECTRYTCIHLCTHTDTHVHKIKCTFVKVTLEIEI